MDPYQQGQSNNPNPYDFILNPQQPKRPKKIPLGGNRFILTIIALVGGAFLLMILVAVILNATAPKKLSKQDLISLAQTQNELMRVSSDAQTNAVQQVTQNLAITINYSMLSQQQQTISLLSKDKVKLGKKDLSLKQDATTDQKLKTAKSTSTYDTTYAQLIQQELGSYANEVKGLYNIATSSSERNLMSGYYDQTQLLISQIPYTQNTINSAGQ